MMRLIISLVDQAYTATTAKTMTYNGSYQELVNSDSVTTGGTMEYVCGSNNTTAPTSGWSTTVPTRMTAGNYYVWWRIKEQGIYNAVAARCLTSAINRADISPNVTMFGWTYGSATNNPSVSGNSGNGITA
ncbi:MAG: hypothetical protein IJ661_01410 [Lachnospiraceae bacterium]|nr:hypothetical protein [Lachnospiraceae bacterium]